VAVTDQPLGVLGILPFGAGQHLLKAIEMFEASQQRLFRQARLTGEQTHALLGIDCGILWQRAALEDAPSRGANCGCVAALAVATGNDHSVIGFAACFQKWPGEYPDDKQ